MTTDPVTLGEVSRGLTALSEAMEKRFTELFAGITALASNSLTLERYVADEHTRALVSTTLDGRISDLGVKITDVGASTARAWRELDEQKTLTAEREARSVAAELAAVRAGRKFWVSIAAALIAGTASPFITLALFKH